MTRKEKYKLDRALIELENAMHDLENRCEIIRTFDSMFDYPMNYLQELLMPVEEEKVWN